MPKTWRLGKGLPIEERFWPKVEKTDGCWNWTGKPDKDGYGMFKIQVDGRWTNRRAHAVSYFIANGEWAKPMTLHLCKGNRACVRPDHLYAGDNSDNQRDAVRDGTHFWTAKTHCPQGHPYSEENTLRYSSGRQCRECRKAANRKQYIKRALRPVDGGVVEVDAGTAT